jgi:hypothetical protein
MEKKKKNEITIAYVVPENLKDCYVNGVIGGISPEGTLSAQFYSERAPIPKSVTYPIVGPDDIIDEDSPEYEVKTPLIRLVQASLVMDLDTAVQFKDWLDMMLGLCFEESESSEEEEEEETPPPAPKSRKRKSETSKTEKTDGTENIPF